MTDVNWDDVQAERDSGKTLKELAAEYGVSTYLIHCHTTQPRAQAGKDWGGAQALRDAGWELEKIANYIGATAEEVGRHTVPARPKKKYENEWQLVDYMRANELI